jgi:hypothetical protein
MVTVDEMNSETDPPNLGRLVQTYHLSKARAAQLSLISAFSLGMSLVCLLPVLFETNETLVTRIALTILGLFVLTPFIFGVYQLIRLASVSLSLYESGLVFRRLGRASLTSWDEVVSFIYSTAIRLEKPGGEVIEFGSSVQRLDEIASTISKQTLQCMLPKARATIAAGGSVQFSGLSLLKGGPAGKAMSQFAHAASGYKLDSRGITQLETGACIPWQAVLQYGIAMGRMGRAPIEQFVVRSNQEAFETRLSLLKNSHLLLALCEEMTGIQPMA